MMNKTQTQPARANKLQKTCSVRGSLCVETLHKTALSIEQAQQQLINKGFSQERVEEITNYLRGLITTIVRDELSQL